MKQGCLLPIAKLAVLTDAEEQVSSTSADGMNKYFEERNLNDADMDTLQAGTQTTTGRWWPCG